MLQYILSGITHLHVSDWIPWLRLDQLTCLEYSTTPENSWVLTLFHHFPHQCLPLANLFIRRESQVIPRVLSMKLQRTCAHHSCPHMRILMNHLFVVDRNYPFPKEGFYTNFLRKVPPCLLPIQLEQSANPPAISAKLLPASANPIHLSYLPHYQLNPPSHTTHICQATT